MKSLEVITILDYVYVTTFATSFYFSTLVVVPNDDTSLAINSTRPID